MDLPPQLQRQVGTESEKAVLAAFSIVTLRQLPGLRLRAGGAEHPHHLVRVRLPRLSAQH